MSLGLERLRGQIGRDDVQVQVSVVHQVSEMGLGLGLGLGHLLT
jgi:hypothetical protein